MSCMSMYADPHDVMSKNNRRQAPAGIEILKKNMKLDLQSVCTTTTTSSMGSKPLKPKFSLLSSPDLNLLKLASPELEKLIIQNHGQVTTTPTPTQFFFPKNVTEEQELYARGFVDALNQLSQEEHTAITSCKDGGSLVTFIPHASGGGSFTALNPTTCASISGGTVSIGMTSAPPPFQPVIPHTLDSPPTVFPHEKNLSDLGIVIKEEPQTVPSCSYSESSSSSDDSPRPSNEFSSAPLSPIDMETQDRIKLERKRLRNRIAATKCRKRKLDRISKLEDKVSILKRDNSELMGEASSLRSQICRIKANIMEHVQNGCQIMMTPSMENV